MPCSLFLFSYFLYERTYFSINFKGNKGFVGRGCFPFYSFPWFFTCILLESGTTPCIIPLLAEACSSFKHIFDVIDLESGMTKSSLKRAKNPLPPLRFYFAFGFEAFSCLYLIFDIHTQKCIFEVLWLLPNT